MNFNKKIKTIDLYNAIIKKITVTNKKEGFEKDLSSSVGLLHNCLPQVDKNIRKVPNYNVENETFYCPNCNNNIEDRQSYNPTYCWQCGQKISWSFNIDLGSIIPMKNVYCTDCWYFRLCDESIPYCVYENECNIDDCDDSKPITERPKYEESYDKKNIKF